MGLEEEIFSSHSGLEYCNVLYLQLLCVAAHWSAPYSRVNRSPVF